MSTTLQLPSLERAEAAPALWIPAPATLELISSHDLAVGFDNRNEALGVPQETRIRTNELLWVLGEHDWRTADHGRRVGGYMEAILRRIGGPEFADDFHAGLLRVGGAVHDIWKQFVSLDTMHRSWGDPGYGIFDNEIDLPRILPHAEGAYHMLAAEPTMPPEAKYIGGCHHQYLDPAYPERKVYGIPLAEIDKAYTHDPAMRDWLHLAVKIAVAGDVFDAATVRANAYLKPGTSQYDYLVSRLQPLFPAQWQEVLGAMQAEQVYYLRSPDDHATDYSFDSIAA